MIIIFILLASLSLYIDAQQATYTVNKTTSLGKFTPTDLASFQGIQMSKQIIPDLKNLLAAAKKDGLTLKAVSGYRSYDYQQKVFNRYLEKERKKNPKISKIEAENLANTYSARPGHSEHQLGTAVDILSAENNYQFSNDKNLKFISWLERNCKTYNFVISYPQDTTEYIYEPWHLRWYPKQSNP